MHTQSYLLFSRCVYSNKKNVLWFETIHTSDYLYLDSIHSLLSAPLNSIRFIFSVHFNPIHIQLVFISHGPEDWSFWDRQIRFSANSWINSLTCSVRLLSGTSLVGCQVEISPGPHAIRHLSAVVRFGGYVFGIADRESYSFQIGSRLAPINQVKISFTCVYTPHY